MLELNRILKEIRWDDIAVSEVVGTVLVLGIVITGLGLILLLSGNVIGTSQSTANINGVEQAFTMADSKLSKARFGTAISQEAPFALRQGTVTVNGTWDDSHITIYDVNDTRILYNASLGTIKCDLDQGEIAYQAGGVWSSDKKNGSVMISPPDFDYNGVTLTLPVMRIDGNASMSTSDNREVVIGVNSSDPVVIFPCAGIGGNPIPSGSTINLTIKSDYYQAWADYINLRTRATAVVDQNKKTVNVSLKTGVPMQSGLAGNGFTTKTMDTYYDAPVEVFKLNLFLRNTGNDYTISYGIPDPAHPDPQLLITVTRTTGHDNKEYAYIEYAYSYQGYEEIFGLEVPFVRKNDDSMDLDMLSRAIRLDYLSTSPSISWGSDQFVPDTDATIVDYEDPYSDVTTGGTKCLNDLTQHYLWLMAYYDQQHANQYNGPFYDVIGKDKYDGGLSTLKLGFKSGQDIKYLYISEGILTTTLSSRS